MIRLRSAQNSDLDAIFQLTQKSEIGITTIPRTKSHLKSRLNLSSASFSKDVIKPDKEYYLFVLEDKGEIVGISAIEARTGDEIPFYSYNICKRTQVSHTLNIRCDHELLTLVNNYQGCSELCTLFLDPKHRQAHHGRLLSKGRLLFMAQYPNRFEETVVAELRGVSDQFGRSPFWDALGQAFFRMTYEKAEILTSNTNKQFIADLMAQYPIYVHMLSEDAQSVIGKTHPNTLPAMHMLLQEGFHYRNYVDIFDAGPVIEALRTQIKTIALSKHLRIKALSKDVQGKKFLISNTQIPFRASVGFAIVDDDDDSCIITQEMAQLLEVEVAASLRLAPID